MLDAALRRGLGVFEFTDDPDCVFRLSLVRAPFSVVLSDGTRVKKGDRVGLFHFWNEHLPQFSASGPDLRWAKLMRKKMRESLCDLAERVERDPGWADVQAFYAGTPLDNRIGARQIERVAGRFGFELAASVGPTVLNPYVVGQYALIWGLTRAFNPSAAGRKRFLRPWHYLWLSRGQLLSRYGRQQGESRIPSAKPDACFGSSPA
jgi:hypothetical protein